MKHSEILDLLEASVTLARALQTGNDAERLRSRSDLEKAIGVLKAELDTLNPPAPNLKRRLAHCVVEVVHIDFH